MKNIAKDPIFAQDQIKDNNKIKELLNISYLLKISKLMIVISNFTFLLAMFWYIMCVLVEDLNDLDYKDID